MKRRSQEEETWAKHHQPVSGSGSVPCRLYTDEDPATTIKGLGFKDAATARTTIRLSGQPGSLYKQFWTEEVVVVGRQIINGRATSRVGSQKTSSGASRPVFTHKAT